MEELMVTRLGTRWLVGLSMVLCLGMIVELLAPASGGPPVAAAAPAGAAPSGLHAAGNRIVDGGGQTVRLLGVNRSGAEFACAQGWGFFDGPSDAASVQAMAAWGINAVRLPMNEDCWLGINGVSAT